MKSWISRRMSPLLSDMAFRRYWLGQSVSLLGGQISMLALPLTAVMVLHATAVGMAFLTAIGSLPSLLFSLHAGAWVDQHGNRRRTMVVADAGRTLLLASIPAAFFLRILSIPLLIGLWFLVRTFSVFFRVASSTLFVSLVPKNRYVEANSLLHTSRATAFFVGPAIAGFLIQTLTAPVTLLADSLSFLTSAASLALIHPQEPAPAQAHRRDLAGGLRFIRRSTVLRYSFASQATMSLFRTMFMAVSILYATRSLGITPTEWGIIFGPSSVGAMAASALAGRFSKRLGLGPTLIWGCALLTVPYLLVPLAQGPHVAVVAMLFFAEGLASSGSMIHAVSDGTIQAAAIPDELRARVSAAFVTVSTGLRPVGALLAGALAYAAGLHATLWVAASGGSLAFLWLLPVRKLGQVESLAEVGAR